MIRPRTTYRCPVVGRRNSRLITYRFDARSQTSEIMARSTPRRNGIEPSIALSIGMVEEHDSRRDYSAEPFSWPGPAWAFGSIDLDLDLAPVSRPHDAYSLILRVALTGALPAMALD